MAQLRYIYSMPVERIVRYFSDNGFHVNKATANGLLLKTADMFENLYKALGRAVLEDNYISCDETYYFYENGSRRGAVIHKKLEKYKGTVQSDGYAPYKSLGNGILRLSCFQHCKRKFLDIEGNPDADGITGLINQLYREEHKHRIGVDGWTQEDNLKWRRKYSKDIMKALKVAIKRIISSPEYPPKSQMYTAANYMLGPMVLTRKNMLFCGNREAAENTAVICSLLGSCKEHGINPREWLNDVIAKRPYYLALKSGKNLEELLPGPWRGCRQSSDNLPAIPGMSPDFP